MICSSLSDSCKSYRFELDARLPERIEAVVRKIVRTGGGVTLVIFLSLSVFLAGCSQEGPAGEEYVVLEADFDADLEDAETSEAYLEVVREFKPRFETFADKYWGTEAALDAKIWLLSNLNIEEDEAAGNKALIEMTDAVFERYSRSPHMEKFASMQGMYSEELRDKYFGDLQENSPHASVRAAVIWAAARNADIDLIYGDEDLDRDALKDMKKNNLEVLVTEYADLPLRNSTYGVAAEAMMNAHSAEDLAIGKPAPEIIGANVDGEEMRLSDFLGKVVVIDFWGDW